MVVNPRNPVADWNQGRAPQQERWGGPITTTQTIGASGTITHNGGAVAKVTSAGVTGVIVQPGFTDGQILFIQNEANQTITMATAATSNVFGGTAIVIPASRSAVMRWDAVLANWFAVFSA